MFMVATSYIKSPIGAAAVTVANSITRKDPIGPKTLEVTR